MTTTQDNQITKILDLTKKWENNRLLYPGWLIAPEQSREDLDEFTQNWWFPVIQAVPVLQLPDALRVLFELIWRMETALLPMWNDIATTTEPILDKVNPYPEAIDLPQAVLKMDSGNRDNLPWNKIRTHWGHLALSILRYHREERHKAAFDKWTTRLESAFRHEVANLARLSNERCLFHLGNSDEASVRAALISWPEQEQDPMWMARKAAILIELGDVQEATPLAEGALRIVRSRRKDPNDFASMSREGWIMLLVSGLENDNWMSGEAPNPHHRGRWEYLKRYRCDPWVELEFFENRVKWMSQEAAPAVTKTFGFRPGSVTRHYRFGGANGPDLRSAYQLMRLAEEAGCPPNFARTTFIGKNLDRIAGLFADTDPVRTHSLLCRLDSTEVVDRYLTRNRVAALSPDVLKELTDVAIDKINQNEPKATGSERNPNDPPSARLARKRLETGIELLARLAVRFSSTESDRILTRAIELFRSHVVQASRRLTKRLKSLFESLISTMTPEQVNSRLIDLMSLPIPGTEELSVQFLNDWPNVLELLPGNVVKQIGQRGAGWIPQIRRLIGILGDASCQNRGEVILRLHRLNKCDLLTKKEIRNFARALWKVRTSESDLPIVRPCRQILVLRLPEPKPGIARERIQSFMRSGDILRVRSQGTGPDGKPNWQYKQFVDPDEFSLNWLHTTAFNPRMKKMEGWRIINWRLSDIVDLFGKIKKWFDDEGRVIQTLPTTSAMSESGIEGGAFRERIDTILQILRDVIFPRLGPEHDVAKEAVALVDEMTTLGVATQLLGPALLKFIPSHAPTIQGNLEKGLVATDEFVYLQSVKGLLFWLRAQGKGEERLFGYELPPVPPSLVTQFCCNFTARRQPGLRITLNGMSTLITECPGAATPEVLRSIELGLELIQSEAGYRVKPDTAGLIPFDEVPRYRCLIAKVVKNVMAILPSAPGSLIAMKHTYENDPLPEVRAVFQSDDDDAE